LSHRVSLSPGTDAAAQTAAAFASCSLLYSQGLTSRTFSPPSLANTSYAQLLLAHAAQLYDFALNASGGLRIYQTSVPQVVETYPSASYGDDLAIAALFLSLTNTSTALANTTAANLSIVTRSPAAFYNQAETFWSQYALEGQDSVFNWDNKAPALPVLFVQAALARPEVDMGHNLSAWQAVSEGYFDRIVGENGRGSMTKGRAPSHPFLRLEC
jgi:endoglucanase